MKPITLLVAGDFCPQYRVAGLFEKKDFETVLGGVKAITMQADYSIVNFECPITYGNEKAINKLGPNLRCSQSGIDALKWAGFNCVTLANNHFYDYGDEGVKNTIEVCDQNLIDYVGGGIDIEKASAILFKEIDGKTLAIINCCEHEFSVATETKGGSNPLNPIQQFYKIQEARKKVDFVLIIVHGGHEHFQLPSPRMQEIYRFFIDAGADAVVNHHQHCFSGYEVYKGKPIIYGLGNLCFDEKDNIGGLWNQGYMVKLFFADVVGFEIFPYNQCSKEPIVSILPAEAYDEKIKELNSIIQDKELLTNRVRDYYKSCHIQVSYIFEPIFNRIYNSLRYRGILPSFVSKKRKIMAFNYVNCESHRDKLLSYLENQNE